MNNSNIWFPFTQMQTAPQPLKIMKAKGALLFDGDEKDYVDANSSWWVNVHGHGHPGIKAAIANQFDEVDHVLLAGVTHPKAEEIASRVSAILPKDLNRVFFSDDGSTAVEVALKMVFQYWHNKSETRKRIIALDGAYHGDTFGAMSIGQRGYFNKPFEHFFFDVDFLDFPSPEVETEVLNHLEALLKTNEIAALILEPLVQGSAGMRMYSPEMLNKMTLMAQKHGVKVIFDEIMTGWGRTGKMFSMDHIEANPDIVCLSKGLTGGVLPMGLTVASDELFNAFLDEDKLKALLHGHSYTGNPLACAAACASLDLFEAQETKNNIKKLVENHEKFAASIRANPLLLDVRQCGTILAVEFDIGNEESSYFSDIREKLFNHFLENGVFLRPLGNIVFFNPPYCITDSELERCYNALLKFLEENK